MKENPNWGLPLQLAEDEPRGVEDVHQVGQARGGLEGLIDEAMDCSISVIYIRDVAILLEFLQEGFIFNARTLEILHAAQVISCHHPEEICRVPEFRLDGRVLRQLFQDLGAEVGTAHAFVDLEGLLKAVILAEPFGVGELDQRLE